MVLLYIFCKRDFYLVDGIWHQTTEQLTDERITSAPLLSHISTLNPLSNVHSSTSNTMLNRVEFKTLEFVGQYILPGVFTRNHLKFKILSRTDQFET